MEEIFVKNIIESMNIGLIVINTEGEIVASNTSTEVILGINGDDLKLKGWAHLFFERESNFAFNQVLVDVVEHQTLNQLRHVPYETPDGEQRFLSITSSFLKAGDKPAGVVMLIDDVTEVHTLHEREKHILHEQHRLQHERVESLQHFSTSIAYQVRNPLTTIGGFAHRMLKKGTDTECKNAGLIINEVERLEAIVRIVEKYTDVSGVKKENVDLITLTDTLKVEIDVKAEYADKTITWETEFGVTTIAADPSYFRTAYRELLQNALDAIRDKTGTISIVSKELNGQHIIQVTDSGQGIMKEDIAFIFDPFFTTNVKKIGMGLAMVQRIISEHQGVVDITSTPGAGTAASITIPAY